MKRLPFQCWFPLVWFVAATVPPVCWLVQVGQCQEGAKGVSLTVDIDGLLEALQSSDPDQRKAAAKALGAAGDSSDHVLKALMKTVGDDEPSNRLVAVESLRRLVQDSTELVPLAMKLLEQEDQLLASRAVQTLVARGENAIPFLIEALKNEMAAYWACLAIEEMGPTAAAALPQVREVLRETQDEDVRIQGLLALANIGPTGIVAQPEVLAALAPSQSSSTKTAAAFAAGSLSMIGTRQALLVNSRSDDPMVTMMSIWALAKLFPDNEQGQILAVNKILAALQDESPALRVLAAKALQQLESDPEIVAPRLAALLRERDPVVSYNLAEAFAAIGPSAVAPAVGSLSNPELRSLALRTIEILGPAAVEAVPRLLALMEEDDTDLREQVQMTIGSIGPEASAATGPLVQSLGDDDIRIRVSALIALGNIATGATAAKDALIRHVQRDKTALESVAAAWALSQLAAADQQAAIAAVPVLVSALDAEDGEIRREAIQALAAFGPSARPALEPLAKIAGSDKIDAEERKAAVAALEQIR